MTYVTFSALFTGSRFLLLYRLPVIKLLPGGERGARKRQRRMARSEVLGLLPAVAPYLPECTTIQQQQCNRVCCLSDKQTFAFPSTSRAVIQRPSFPRLFCFPPKRNHGFKKKFVFFFFVFLFFPSCTFCCPPSSRERSSFPYFHLQKIPFHYFFSVCVRSSSTFCRQE